MSLKNLANAISRVKNAQMSRHAFVDIPRSKLVLNVFSVVNEAGYTSNIQVVESEKKSNKVIRIQLKYSAVSEIPEMTYIPKYRREESFSKQELLNYQERIIPLGLGVVSTSGGVKSIYDAIDAGLGGILLLVIN